MKLEEQTKRESSSQIDFEALALGKMSGVELEGQVIVIPPAESHVLVLRDTEGADDEEEVGSFLRVNNSQLPQTPVDLTHDSRSDLSARDCIQVPSKFGDVPYKELASLYEKETQLLRQQLAQVNAAKAYQDE